MLKVTIYNNEKNECVGFRAWDHAEQAEPGRDVVCAAASILMFNTVNAIEQFAGDECTIESDQEKGLLDYRLVRRPGSEAVLLLKTMILGLTSMEEDAEYTQYIDIIFEEV